MAQTINGGVCVSFIMIFFACSASDDPREQVSHYATDPIPCVDESDCCIVNDVCHSTAYLVASKDFSKVSSLIASADNANCDRCITPRIQVSCVSGVCAGKRINGTCLDQLTYPGNHCGKVDVPVSCMSSNARGAAPDPSPVEGTSKSLAIFTCGG